MIQIMGSTARILCVGAALLFQISLQDAVGAHTNGVCSRNRFLTGLGTCPLPLDEASAGKKGDWSPWTHRPRCTNPTSRPGPNPNYCLYTDASFRGSRGISMVTAPHLAASIVDTLQDAGVPPRLRDHPSNPLSGKSDQEPAFKVRRIPGRGKGTVATRNIRRWELIIVDYPTVLAQNTFPDAQSQEDIITLLHLAVDQLPDAQRKKVLGLAHTLGGDVIRDILRTNVFGGVEINGVNHIGLFPLGSVSRRFFAFLSSSYIP